MTLCPVEAAGTTHPIARSGVFRQPPGHLAF